MCRRRRRMLVTGGEGEERKRHDDLVTVCVCAEMGEGRAGQGIVGQETVVGEGWQLKRMR